MGTFRPLNGSLRKLLRLHSSHPRIRNFSTSVSMGLGNLKSCGLVVEGTSFPGCMRVVLYRNMGDISSSLQTFPFCVCGRNDQRQSILLICRTEIIN